MSINKKPKLEYLDAIRTFSFFAVLMQHILGSYLRRDNVSETEMAVIALLFCILKYAAPAFIFLSGVVLFYNFYGKLDYLAFLKKRLLSIIIPYVAWAFIYYYQSDILGYGTTVFNISEFLRLLITGNVSYHTWYVCVIIQFYIFLPIIFLLFEKLSEFCNTKNKKIALCISLCVLYILILQFDVLSKNIPIFGYFLYFKKSVNFLYYLPYFVLGGIAALDINYFVDTIKKWLLPIIAMFIGLYAYIEYHYFDIAFVNDITIMEYFTTFRPDMFVYSIISIAILFILCRMLWNVSGVGIKKIFAFFGEHSYFAYLAHAFFMLFISLKLIDYTGNDMPYPLFYTIMTIGTIFLSYLFGYVFDKVYGRVNTKLHSK